MNKEKIEKNLKILQEFGLIETYKDKKGQNCVRSTKLGRKFANTVKK